MSLKERAFALGRWLRSLTWFDFVVWTLFVLWCVVRSPKLQRHLVAIHDAHGTMRTSDAVWNIASDLLPFVAAFGVCVLAVRLLRWINRKIK